MAAYKLWHTFFPTVLKTARHTLGAKIDFLFVELLELLFTASYSSKERKTLILQNAKNKLDLLKFFSQILWEIKALDNKKYITLSKKLFEIGNMLGGWSNYLTKENPTQ